MQPDQINMAVLLFYLVKRDWSSVLCTLLYTSLLFTRYLIHMAMYIQLVNLCLGNSARRNLFRPGECRQHPGSILQVGRYVPRSSGCVSNILTQCTLLYTRDSISYHYQWYIDKQQQHKYM